MTIRQVREVVEGLLEAMPDVSLLPELPERFFDIDQTLEETVREFLARLPDAPVPPDEAMLLLQVKMRLRFAAECIRQTEEAHPEIGMDGTEIPKLLRHWMLDLWPEHGKAWAIATFGPRMRVR